jgi:hypothetical protein
MNNELYNMLTMEFKSLIKNQKHVKIERSTSKKSSQRT